MKKQTATEWLFRQLWEEPKDKFTWYAILNKAMQMEKQQIKDAYKFGLQDEYVIGSEQYYHNYIGTDCP